MSTEMSTETMMPMPMTEIKKAADLEKYVLNPMMGRYVKKASPNGQKIEKAVAELEKAKQKIADAVLNEMQEDAEEAQEDVFDMAVVKKFKALCQRWCDKDCKGCGFCQDFEGFVKCQSGKYKYGCDNCDYCGFAEYLSERAWV